MYKHTFCKLRTMLILLNGFHCKICPLPTIHISHLYCWQWANQTMGPNERNQHFAVLRQKVCLSIHKVVLLRCLPSLDDKLEGFVAKKWEKRLPNSSQTDYSSSVSKVTSTSHTYKQEYKLLMVEYLEISPYNDFYQKNNLNSKMTSPSSYIIYAFCLYY